mmetsp:Transcript_4443/g.8015  ORF Transcript_4443/g.8015 Transcript_4443/m.8015 type:complete len:220 (-) Transcript_4443:128-787(-)
MGLRDRRITCESAQRCRWELAMWRNPARTRASAVQIASVAKPGAAASVRGSTVGRILRYEVTMGDPSALGAKLGRRWSRPDGSAKADVAPHQVLARQCGQTSQRMVAQVSRCPRQSASRSLHELQPGADLLSSKRARGEVCEAGAQEACRGREEGEGENEAKNCAASATTADLRQASKETSLPYAPCAQPVWCQIWHVGLLLMMSPACYAPRSSSEQTG